MVDENALDFYGVSGWSVGLAYGFTNGYFVELVARWSEKLFGRGFLAEAVVVEVKVPVVLFPSLLRGVEKVFFVFIFASGVVVVVALVVGLFHAFGSMAYGFVFKAEFDVVEVLEDPAGAAHESIE